MRRIVVPPAPGLFSSFGLLYADVEHHYVRTWRRLVREADPGRSGGGPAAAWKRAPARSSRRRASRTTAMRLRRSADCRYQGQSFELTVPVADGPIDAGTLAALAEAFGAGARADVRPPRRARGARRDREPPRGRPGRLRSPARARDDPHRPSRRRRPTDAPRVLRPRPRLARDADPRPPRPRHAARGPVHRRGVRRDVCGASRRARDARRATATSPSSSDRRSDGRGPGR